MQKKATLSNKILKYTGAAGAVLAGGAVQGQILYTDFNPDGTIVGTGVGEFDLNQDNTADFGLAAIDTTIGASNLGVALALAVGSQGHAIVGSTMVFSTASYFYALKLNAGDVIDGNQPTLATSAVGTMAFTVNGSNPFSEPWNGGVTNGFLGVTMQVNGATHYGWIRCDVSADAKTITVKDAAINLTAGAAINAGQSVSTVEEMKAKMTVVTTGKTLRIEVPAEMSNYSLQLLDITGKVVVDTEVNGLSYNVNTANLSDGVYILNTRFGDTILSRKVSLQ